VNELSNEQEQKEMREAREEWEKATLEGKNERKERFVTTSSLAIERLYTPEHVKDLEYLRDLNFPGQYPFTRGVQANMHRGRLWTMRQFAGFGTAEETNKRFKYLLAHGETGLSTAFDYPTLYGRDSDDPLAEGEFGKCGVAISSLKDMEILFDGIPMEAKGIHRPEILDFSSRTVHAAHRGHVRIRLQGAAKMEHGKYFRLSHS
jgi:methylmalonyl-CoA mutase N-terminal domain/subunit